MNVEHEKRNSITTSNNVLFCLFYKLAKNVVFDDFPKISDHFSKISEDHPKVVRRPPWPFPNIFRNFRRLPKTSEEHPPKMLRSYTYGFKYSERVNHDINITPTISSQWKIIAILHVKLWLFSGLEILAKLPSLCNKISIWQILIEFKSDMS